MKTEECQKFIVYMLQSVTKVDFLLSTPEQCITVSFLRKMLSSANTVIRLGENGYDSCIIASHMAEGILLLIWILEDKKRIDDYADYNIIEMLALLRVNVSYKDFLLKEIKKRNIQRLLKDKIKNSTSINDDILLNQENYYNRWYKPEINRLSDIKEKLCNSTNQKNAEMIYDMYQKLCPYKHYAPAVMPTWFNVTDEWVMKPLNTAVVTTMYCLYLMVIYTSQFQNTALDVDDIVKHYNQVLGL